MQYSANTGCTGQISVDQYWGPIFNQYLANTSSIGRIVIAIYLAQTPVYGVGAKGAPTKKKKKCWILCPREPSLKNFVAQCFRTPQWQLGRGGFSQKPAPFRFSSAALRPGLFLCTLADSLFCRALLSITIPFPGLPRRTYVVARRTCFSCTAVPAPSRAKMYVVAP
jgi:hypothetical protein